MQAKELQEAQTQRKLAVQEVTDLNEKVNEMRSKNVKLSNELLSKDDLIEELQRSLSDVRADQERKEKNIEDLKVKVSNLNDTTKQLESEKYEVLQRLAE